VNLGVVMMYVAPVLMTVFGLVFLYFIITQPAKGPPLPFMLFWVAGVSWFFFTVLRIPHTIRVHDGGRIEFVSPLRRWDVPVHEITYVGPERGHIGILIVRSSAGKIRLLNQFDGFHRFLTELETLNPGIEFRGC
jgi:hypothetical protein